MVVVLIFEWHMNITRTSSSPLCKTSGNISFISLWCRDALAASKHPPVITTVPRCRGISLRGSTVGKRVSDVRYKYVRVLCVGTGGESDDCSHGIKRHRKKKKDGQRDTVQIKEGQDEYV